jgi:hypothetical protein
LESLFSCRTPALPNRLVRPVRIAQTINTRL